MPYRNPPQVNAADLAAWTHQQQNYFWHPPAQQAEHPHLHLTGGTVNGVVTIANLSYTTREDPPNNMNLPFDPNNGFPPLPADIQYSRAYNIRIDDLNHALLRV
jgi:hypothetical protein